MFPITKTTCILLLLLACHVANAQRFPVVIHEIMADPLPSAGLPNAEYIELRNMTQNVVSLSGWRLLTASSKSGLFPAYLLQPDSLVVITGRSDAALFGPNTIGVASFPALPNGGTLLQVLDASNNVVHAVAYETSWYRDAIKKEGGWSLEMIDAANQCGGAANWQAATAPLGGTPGRPNSVSGQNADAVLPQFSSAIAIDSVHLLLRFNEPMDSSSMANPQHYLLEPDIGILGVAPVAPMFESVVLTLSHALQPQKIYSITATNIQDCAGNKIGIYNNVKTGLPQPAAAGDVVINEILFNPKGDVKDYVELYNRSNKIIDLSNMQMSNATSAPKKIVADPLYLFPSAYLVVTEDRDAVLRHYLAKDEGALIGVLSLPSLPDDKGSFVLLNEVGLEVDKLIYAESWHFALIADAEGVALERIDPNKPTQQKENWTSAAATAGFGTPTYRNAQYVQSGTSNATFDISPKILSPNGDGFNDFCTIRFDLTEPNYVANLTIFDVNGRKVRQLIHNQTLAQTGSWRWDGLGERGQVLASGTYVILIELFNLRGKKQQAKLAVTLARR